MGELDDKHVLHTSPARRGLRAVAHYVAYFRHTRYSSLLTYCSTTRASFTSRRPM